MFSNLKKKTVGLLVNRKRRRSPGDMPLKSLSECKQQSFSSSLSAGRTYDSDTSEEKVIIGPVKTRGPLSLAPRRAAAADPAGRSSFTAIDNPSAIHHGQEPRLMRLQAPANLPTPNAEAGHRTGEVGLD